MKAYSLYEGSYSVDSSKTFVPFDEQKDDKASRKGSLFIHVHPFLIKTKKDLILLDTGLGYQAENGELVLHENIRLAGFDPKDVTYVLMSHLHADHAGGMVVRRQNNLVPAFPHAKYVIAKKEWDKAYQTTSISYPIEIYDVIKDQGNIEFVDGDGIINEAIRYAHSGGHTEWHQVFYVEEEGEVCFFSGDEWPESPQALKRYIFKYDYDGQKAMQLREEYVAEAAEKGWICLFYHNTKAPFGKVEKREDGFSIIDYRP